MKISAYNKCSFIDYPDHIASVVFTCGCNMVCPYCHNKELLNWGKYDIPSIFDHLKKRRGYLDGVVICGGEPTIHRDLPDFIARIKDLGYDVKLDSNGSNPKMLKQLINDKLIDYVAMDIKTSDEKYFDLTKVDFEEIKDSIDILRDFGRYEFRTTAYPEIKEADFIKLLERHQDDNYVIQQFIPNSEDDPSPYPKEFFLKLQEGYSFKLRGFD